MTLPASDRLPTTVTPAAVVLPDNPTPIEYHQVAGRSGADLFRLSVLVVAARFPAERGQEVLDGFLSGPNSVKALVEADPTLDGLGHVRATSAESYGLVQIADSDYYGCTVRLEVLA